MSEANTNPHLGADPTTEMKLDRLLARNALTSLGQGHPANVNRAARRRAKVKLDPMHRELKAKTQRRSDDA